MSTSPVEIAPPRATRASVTEDTLTIDLADGRSVSVPIGWYPRLVHGSDAERNRIELIGGGEGLHWPDLDEDVSVRNLLAGQPSGESQSSFAQWLESRSKAD